MRTTTNGWRAVVLTGLLVLTGALPLEAGPEGRPEVPPEMRQEYRERMRALHGEFRSRLRSLKAEYRARRQALRAEFQARRGMQSPQAPPGPAPESPMP
ncbi:MAG: hypothetical protein HYY54_07710 [candidate division NC10 bacterium]|nr:hypothetical protein [candidate division NC10 bacterium]